MFEHRKYHWLYFVLGICIAVILASLMGCEQPQSTSGVIKEEPPNICVWDCPPPPQYCCMALTPECEACQDGCSVDIWLERTCGVDAIDAEYAGWDEEKNEPIWLCQAIIID
jgi:hypothetical protein